MSERLKNHMMYLCRIHSTALSSHDAGSVGEKTCSNNADEDIMVPSSGARMRKCAGLGIDKSEEKNFGSIVLICKASLPSPSLRKIS